MLGARRGAYALRKGGALVTLNAPSTFAARWTPSFAIKKRGSTYSTDFDITTVKPAIDVQYYVDLTNGNNANDGLSRGAPKKTLAAALAMAPAGATIGILIINMTADVIARGSNGWNNVQPTKNVVVEVEGSYRVISAGGTGAPTTADTYTKTAGQTHVYEITTSSATTSIIDVSSKRQPVDPVSGATLSNVPPIYKTYTKVASIAAVDATPGSFFPDVANTKIYIRTFDDRVPDGLIIRSANANNGRMSGTGQLTYYVKGIDFVGGSSPFLALSSTASNLNTLAFNNCSFQGSVGAANGLAIQTKGTVYVYRCGAYYNGADGFNYHSQGSNDTGANDLTNSSPNWFEWESAAEGNGTTGNTGSSDNASTSHDYCNGIRLNCAYLSSDDVVVADTNSAYVWELGCSYGPSVKGGAANDNNAALVHAKKWADGGKFAPANGAGAYQLSARDAGSQVLHRNSVGLTATGGAGTLGTY